VATLTAVTVAVVIYFASFITISGGLTPGEFVAFITALAMVFGPIRRLSAVHVTLQKGLAGAESIFKLLDTAGEEQTVARREWTGSSLRGAITFKNVFFSYPGQSLAALRDCSFDIAAGEAVAMIGPSGAGKSTVLNLIAGFYSPTVGNIFIDGQDIQSISLDFLRRHISLVGQSVMLFDASIADNVRLGNPAASQIQIEQAVRKAHAWEFVSRLPDGLSTPLGSLGSRLSGGQRPRIAIARAFLKDAPILLLDEPTSALDRESEAAVSEGIRSLMVGRTVIWVSHSPERLVGIDRTILIS
jgi:subfamily B ATP-binding cassette protein MsbA